MNFYKGSCVGPDTVVGVDVADAFHQVTEGFDTNFCQSYTMIDSKI